MDELNRNAANKKDDSVKKGYIPCLYLPYLGGSSKLLIYFHGNAEDVGLAMELLAFVKDMLKVSLVFQFLIAFFLHLLGSCVGYGVSWLRRL